MQAVGRLAQVSRTEGSLLHGLSGKLRIRNRIDYQMESINRASDHN